MEQVIRSGVVEVVAIDVDALLEDACDVLRSGVPSALLEAIDVGALVAVMSDQAFWEVGWMSAPTARRQGVTDDDLRRLVTSEYLPRIPVVSTGRTVNGPVITSTGQPDIHAGYWLPAVTDVRDPKDIAHVQVALLVSATAVYSHDRHLRVPGHAPRNRPEFNQRLEHLRVVTTHRQQESGAVQVIGLAGRGTGWALGRTASLVGVSGGVAWAMLGAAAATTALWALGDSSRRDRFAGPFRPVLASIGEAYARHEQSLKALGAARLLTPAERGRLEVRVASHLVRNSNTTMTDIAEELELTTEQRRHLSVLLRGHPSFEKARGAGWSVGRLRHALETEPPKNWKPRERPVG